jgi:hypothetical protein
LSLKAFWPQSQTVTVALAVSVAANKINMAEEPFSVEEMALRADLFVTTNATGQDHRRLSHSSLSLVANPFDNPNAIARKRRTCLSFDEAPSFGGPS